MTLLAKRFELLSEREIHSIWIHYMVTMVALKHNFIIVEKIDSPHWIKIEKEVIKQDGTKIQTTEEVYTPIPWQKYRGKPYKEIEGFALFNLWKDTYIMDFDEFCQPQVSETNWNTESKLSEWHWKFKDEFNFEK